MPTAQQRQLWAATYKAKNPEKFAAQTKKAKAAYRSTAKGRARMLLDGSRRRAQRAGLEHALSLEWMQTRLDGGRCEATGLPFDLTAGNGWCAWAPSVDRIDNARGYVAGNARLVVHMFNVAKGPYSDDDLKQFIRVAYHKFAEPV